MSLLFLKKGGRALKVSRASADKVEKIIQDITIPDDDWIVIPEYTGIKRSIEGIQKVDDEDRSEWHIETLQDKEKQLQKFNKDYEDYIAEQCDTPVSVKSKNTNIAATIYMGMTGYRAPEKFLLEVVKRQEIYFSTHSRYPYANPECYKDLIPKVEKSKSYETMVELKPLVSHASVRFAEHAVGEAFRTAKALHLIK